jgi:hypothetical protein
MAYPVKHVFRWDLDKTYLVSQFESLRDLLAVPFERGRDKVSMPGVAAVIKALRRGQETHGRATEVLFLSASPPQIGAAIRDKLAIDGIEYEGITFKDQVGHIVRGRFDVLREQIGYKLERLLASAREMRPEVIECLFGDDWESDPFVYSLYADLLDGRVAPAELFAVLERAGVHRHYVDRIRAHVDWLEHGARRHRVMTIYILRQRRVSAESLAPFGPRLVWFDNYFECALNLWARALIGLPAVVEILANVQLDPAAATASFTAAAGRPPLQVGHLEPVRKRLLSEGLISTVAKGRLPERANAAVRRAFRLPSMPSDRLGPPPRYGAIVDLWSHRARKERRRR